LILSAIITPPDWITQIIVSLPLLLLYEVGILVAVRVEKNVLKATKT
jgi:sec-independent protein translocase protein TatC